MRFQYAASNRTMQKRAFESTEGAEPADAEFVQPVAVASPGRLRCSGQVGVPSAARRILISACLPQVISDTDCFLNSKRTTIAARAKSICRITLIASSMLLLQKSHADNVNLLGTPWQDRYGAPAMSYARNIWDLKLFNGRLYVGGGNSSNHGPSANAGPVPILAYDIQAKQWTQEGVANDDQIDRFKQLGEKLVIPGNDPRQNWKLGNAYVRSSNGKWLKKRSIPDGVHTYDIVQHESQWFAAIGTGSGGGTITASSDEGDTWATKAVVPRRVYGFVSVGQHIFAHPGFRFSNGKISDHVWRLSADQWIEQSDEISAWYPGSNPRGRGEIRLLTSESAKDMAVYIGSYSYDGHSVFPFGVYQAHIDSAGRIKAESVELPADFEPWDLVSHDGTIFLLLNRRRQHDAEVQIWSLNPEKSKKWEVISRFIVPGFARSLEVSDGAFFVGTGYEPHPEEAPEIEQKNVGLLFEIVRSAGSKIK